ncbi:glycosyltransferase family 4 protein [Methanothermobacter sp. THM-1]|uniref:glycosyltransferase n=1 Tax=Methanothermobacter sp. THM-1 TaxID=2606911 RepID=UPI0013670E21|nr:glycosyltransferase [Methanothermobacter sp. THM-1]QHN06252.1 glycosyltransferase family 4 protein [Methanothermobacter sp. THM-1]
MRILVVQESDWLERNPHQQHHLFDRLSERGHEVRVIDYPIDWRKNERGGLINPRRVYMDQHKVRSSASVDVLRPAHLKLPVLDYLSIPFTHGREIRRQIREFRPDVIVGFGLINSYIAASQARRHGIPFVYYLIDVLYTLIPERAFQGLGRWLMERTIRGADLVLTINRKLDALAVEFGAERTEVIDAGIDLSEFDPHLDGSGVRRKYGVADHEILLFFMGFLYDFAGLKELAAAMAENRDRYPDIKLMVVGDGDACSDLKRIRDENNLETLILTGRQPYTEIPEFLTAADICILPAYIDEEIMQDIVPIKLYEYLAMAKPVIATRLPGIVMEFGEGNGIHYIERPEETLEVASGLAGRLREEGMKGRRFVESNDWETITDRFEGVLEDLIRR